MDELKLIAAVIDKLTVVGEQGELLTTLKEVFEVARERPVRIGFVNAHSINLMCRDQQFRADLLDCDFLFRDGVGIKVLLMALGHSPGLNLNGTDLIPKMLRDYDIKDVALMGTQKPYLTTAAERIAALGPMVSTIVDGFQKDPAYLGAVEDSTCQLLLLGMGMPKQERIARILAERLQRGCVIVCGGAILDFIGGKVKRAPVIFRKLGVEWFYRLAREPRRLFSRYVIGNFVFLWRVGVVTVRVRVLRTHSFGKA